MHMAIIPAGFVFYVSSILSISVLPRKAENKLAGLLCQFVFCRKAFFLNFYKEKNFAFCCSFSPS